MPLRSASQPDRPPDEYRQPLPFFWATSVQRSPSKSPNAKLDRLVESWSLSFIQADWPLRDHDHQPLAIANTSVKPSLLKSPNRRADTW